MRKTTVFAATATTAIAVLVAGGAQASSALRAIRFRVGNHPAFVRVVTDFTGGALVFNKVEATDPGPFDGTATVAVTDPAASTSAATVHSLGVTVRAVRVNGRVDVKLAAAPRRFKYLAYALLHAPERLVIDLWKSAPPTSATTITRAPNLCLTFTRRVIAPHLATATGTERGLFEEGFRVDVRRANGGIAGRASVVASSNQWTTRVPYSVATAQPGTLEAVDLSPKDGALDCIVQVRAALRP